MLHCGHQNVSAFRWAVTSLSFAVPIFRRGKWHWRKSTSGCKGYGHFTSVLYELFSSCFDFNAVVSTGWHYSGWSVGKLFPHDLILLLFLNRLDRSRHLSTGSRTPISGYDVLTVKPCQNRLPSNFSISLRSWLSWITSSATRVRCRPDLEP